MEDTGTMSDPTLRCNACGREVPIRRALGSKYRVCSVDCVREMEWRDALCILGKPYRPSPETEAWHMHLDGIRQKYIPVDDEELREMLANARTDALEEAALEADAYAHEMLSERAGDEAGWHELSREREGVARTCALRIRRKMT
jgi:hypothetical protein